MSDIVSEFRAAAVFFGSGSKTEIAGKLFAGKHNLAHIISRDLGKFSNGEVKLEINDNIRGSNITYFAPDTGDVFDDIMETLITLDCMRRHGAQKIVLFLPQSLVALKASDNPDSPFGPELFSKFIRMFDVDQVRNYDNKPVVFPRAKAVSIIREPGAKTVIARGHSAAKLAKDIASPRELNLPIIDWRKQQNLKDQNVIVLASTAGNPNRAVLETAAMIYHLRRQGAALINVVLPLWHYARQERTDNRRVPISAAVVGRILNTFKPNSILTQDIHQPAIQGFGRETPVEPIYSTALIAAKIAQLVKENKLDPADILIGAVDRGAIGRATQLRRQLKDNYNLDISADIPTVDKRREPDGKSEVKDISHKDKIAGKILFFVDDMTDSGGTFEGAAIAAKAADAKIVIGFVTHVVSAVNPATKMLNIAKLEASGDLDALVGLDTASGLTPAMRNLNTIDIMSNSNWLARNIREWAWWLKASHEDASLKTLNDRATPAPPRLRQAVEAHLSGILQAFKLTA